MDSTTIAPAGADGYPEYRCTANIETGNGPQRGDCSKPGWVVDQRVIPWVILDQQ